MRSVGTYHCGIPLKTANPFSNNHYDRFQTLFNLNALKKKKRKKRKEKKRKEKKEKLCAEPEYSSQAVLQSCER